MNRTRARKQQLCLNMTTQLLLKLETVISLRKQIMLLIPGKSFPLKVIPFNRIAHLSAHHIFCMISTCTSARTFGTR